MIKKYCGHMFAYEFNNGYTMILICGEIINYKIYYCDKCQGGGS